MKIHQIIAEDPQVLSILDPAGNYQVKLDNGSIKTFPDRASADAWAKDPKNIASSRFDAAKPQIDPKTGKPVGGLKAPTAQQRADYEKKKANLKKQRDNLNKKVLIKAPWNKSGTSWKPEGVKGGTIALLNFLGAATLAYSWWRQVEQLKIHAKNENPDQNLEKFQTDNLNAAGEYDLTRVTPDQIYQAIDSSSMTSEASAQWKKECMEYAKNTIATEAAIVAATFIISAKAQGQTTVKLVRLLQVGMAGGGAGAMAYAGLVGGAPAAVSALAMLFGAVSVDVLAGAMAALLATETGKKFITETILWAMGALWTEGENLAKGNAVMQSATTDKKTGPAQQGASQPAPANQNLTPDEVRKQLGVSTN